VKAKFIKVEEVKLGRESLNQVDVFILDGGLQLWQWNGASSNIWEKRKGEETVDGIRSERGSRPTKTVLDSTDDDEKFWAIMGGKGAIAAGDPKPAAPAPGSAAATAAATDGWHPDCSKELWSVVVAPGASEATFSPIRVGGAKVEWKDFKSDGVFILDIEDETKHHHVYVWVGHKTSKTHVKLAMSFGEEFGTKQRLPEGFNVTRVVQGGHRDPSFHKAVADLVGKPRPAKTAAGAASSSSSSGASTPAST